MKTYLVTGGAGFIGSNFVIYLLNKYKDIQIMVLDALTYAGSIDNLEHYKDDKRVIFIEGDIRDKALVKQLFDTNSFDYVVNFAAESHVDRSITEASSFVTTNVYGTVCLLNAAKEAWQGEYDKHKFLQVSTDEVYGSLDKSEDLFTEKTPICPSSPYSASKASADAFVLAFHTTYGLNINITRCSNNFGIKQHDEKFIPIIINSFVNNLPVPIYGDGKQIRDWLFVDDHCHAIDLVLNQGKNGEIYNVGGNNEVENIDLVEKIGHYLVVQGIINDFSMKYVEDRKGHDRRYGIDSTKIQTELGWKPSIDIDKKLSETIDWYVKKYQGKENEI